MNDVYLYSVCASSRKRRYVITVTASSCLAFVERASDAKSRPSKAETNALGYFRRIIPNISNRLMSSLPWYKHMNAL